MSIKFRKHISSLLLLTLFISLFAQSALATGLPSLSIVVDAEDAELSVGEAFEATVRLTKEQASDVQFNALTVAVAYDPSVVKVVNSTGTAITNTNLGPGRIARSDMYNADLGTGVFAEIGSSLDNTKGLIKYTIYVSTEQSEIESGMINVSDAFDAVKFRFKTIAAGNPNIRFALEANEAAGSFDQSAPDGYVIAPGVTAALVNPTIAVVDPAADATLNALSVSEGTLTPAFDSAVTDYTVTLPYAQTTVPTVTAAANNAQANAVVTDAAQIPGTTTVAVTAANGTTVKTYNVAFVKAAPSTVAKLNSLTVSAGTLSPAFDPETKTYSVVLPYETAAAPTVAATASDNGTAVVTPAAALPGAATVVVTAQDGTTTETYTVNFTKELPSTNADLASLTLSAGTIVFNPATISYNVVLPYGTTQIPTVDAAKADSHADVLITQASMLPGAATVVVTAQDNTIKTYTVNFTVQPNTDATLSGITLSSGTLSPAFSSDQENYTVTLPYTTTVPASITATATDSVNAVVNVTPATTVAAFDATPVATDKATIVVTAADGTTTKTYTVTFKQAAPILPVSVTISGASAVTTNGGTLQLSASVLPADALQGVIWSVENGTGSAEIDQNGLLTAKTNGTVTVKATSSIAGLVNGTKVITISGQETAGLTGLTISGGTLTPAFALNVTQFSAEVDSDVTSISVTPTAVAGATITVSVNNGTPATVVSGEASGALALNPGLNSITVKVSEAGKNDKTYTINVSRAYPFTISTSTLNTTGGISVQATVTPVTTGRNSVVIFKLVDANGTPISIVAVEDNITAATTFTAQFPGYTGSGYKVKVFVVDQLSNSLTSVGIDQAAPVFNQ